MTLRNEMTMNVKNIFTKIILVLLVISGITEGCKKYEEGPMISFRSVKDRLFGYYILTTYTVNNEDELDQYYDSLSKNFDIFYDDVNYRNVCNMAGSRNDGGTSTLVWTWGLINNNKILKVTSSGGNYSGWSSGPFRNDVDPEWEILRLTNKEVKMKTNYNEKEYLIQLQKQ
jgi:hypothetical protein